MPKRSPLRLLLVLLLASNSFMPVLIAQETPEDLGPTVEVTMKQNGSDKSESISSTLRMVVLMTMLSLAPAMLVMMTSFTRIVIVLGFVRHALSTQQVPPNMVLIGLSLFMTMFMMAPVFERVKEDAYVPYMEGQLGQEEAFTKGLEPFREFMGRQTRQKDLALFIELSGAEEPNSFEDVKITALVPAFIISELRTAFHMGFMIFLPFIVIDLVIASVLMSLGMVMLPPAMIALPIKLLLFVLADGWHLVVQSLATSFAVG